MLATIIIFAIAGIAFGVVGHRVDVGPGSADERIASVIPYFFSAGCFLVAIVLFIIWLIIR